MLWIILVQDFCPLKIKFTQFPNGLRLKVLVGGFSEMGSIISTTFIRVVVMFDRIFVREGSYNRRLLMKEESWFSSHFFVHRWKLHQTCWTRSPQTPAGATCSNIKEWGINMCSKSQFHYFKSTFSPELVRNIYIEHMCWTNSRKLKWMMSSSHH